MDTAMGCGSSKSTDVRKTYREYYKEQSTCISYVSTRGEPDGQDDKLEKDECHTSTSSSSSSGLLETEDGTEAAVEKTWGENHAMRGNTVVKP